MSQTHQANTFLWDIVYAIQATEVNRVIAAGQSSPHRGYAPDFDASFDRQSRFVERQVEAAEDRDHGDAAARGFGSGGQGGAEDEH